MEFMNEYSEIIIPFLGMVTAFMVWLQLRTQSSMKDKDAKLETLETRQIKIQSEADNQKVQLGILRDVINNDAKSDERWQTVVTSMTDQRREGDLRLANAIEQSNTNIKRNGDIMIDLKSYLEINTAQLQKVAESSHRAESQAKTAAVESVATRASVDSIKDTIKQSFEVVENTLKNLQQRFEDMLDMQTVHIETQGKRHDDIRNEIKAVADAIKTMSLVLNNIHSLVEKLDTPQPIALPSSEKTIEKEESVQEASTDESAA